MEGERELLEMLYKKVLELDKKVEKYFSILEINNELDFILKGGYLLQEDIDEVILGENANE